VLAANSSLAARAGFTPEFALLIDALKLAAKLQQGEPRGNVILSAIGAVVIVVLVNEHERLPRQPAARKPTGT
jgi:hypothetical protein